MTMPHNLGQPGPANTMSSLQLAPATRTSSKKLELLRASSSADLKSNQRSNSGFRSPGRWVKTNIFRRGSRQSTPSIDSDDGETQLVREVKRSKAMGFLRIFGASPESRHAERKEADKKRRDERKATLAEYRTFERADYWMCYCNI